MKISRTYLGDLECGRTYPNHKLICSIAEKCGVLLSFFVESISTTVNEMDLENKASIKSFNNEQVQTKGWNMQVDFEEKCVNINLEKLGEKIVLTREDFGDLSDLFELLRLKEKGLF